jgi:hypothetical protein
LQAAQSLLEQCLETLQPVETGWAWDATAAYLDLSLLALAGQQPQLAQAYLAAAFSLCQERKLDGYRPLLSALRNLAGLPAGANELSDEREPGSDSPGQWAWLISWARYQRQSTLGRQKDALISLEQAYQRIHQYLAGLPTDQQHQAWDKVPEYRLIAYAWNMVQPQRRTVNLPSPGAPLGRPLRPDEWVEIVWTVAVLEDEAIPGPIARRRHRLARLLREAAAQNAAPAYRHLAEALGVSVRTVVTDMATLRQTQADLPPVRRAAKARTRKD